MSASTASSSPTASGLTGGTLDLVLGVPQSQQVRSPGPRCRVGLDVEGRTSVTSPTRTISPSPNGETTLVTLPLRFGWSGVGSAVRAALGYGDIPYKMKGRRR